MKKRIYYWIALTVLFLAALAVLLFFTVKNRSIFERGNNTEPMGEAVLPVVYVCYNDIKANPLHGYVDDMYTMAMRDTLSPLEADRRLALYIDTFGTDINNISYEVRTLNMDRILEKTAVTDWEKEGFAVTAVLPIENLLAANEEYSLTIRLTLKDGREVSYYTRIVWGLENIYEKFFYVKDFNEKTFDKDMARDIVKYLESSAKGDNTNYGNVNIYSSFNQITWGNLEVEPVGEKSVSLKETNGNISYFQVEYCVNIKNMYGTREMYKVKEYYRTRYTSTRTYLLEFERTMEQYFRSVSENVQGSRINLGITADVNTYVNTVTTAAAAGKALESPSKKRVCFVRNGELWQYYAAENAFTRVFSFAEKPDIRTLWGRHDIKIADIDDDGNIIFIVYGYMSCGKNEGRVGVSVCRYDEKDGAFSELFYIPYDKQFSMLAEHIGGVCYVNSSNWLFFMLEGSLYSLDLASREYIVLVDGLKEGSYIVNEDRNTLVWQTQEKDGVFSEIKILNFDTSVEQSITCGRNESMRLIGYTGGDIVYGVVKYEDIISDTTGGKTFYMYKICIINEDKTQVGSYEKENIYVDNATISGGMITLSRFEKSEDGGYEKISGDYLTSNISEKKKPLSMDVVVTELKKKEIWLNISKTEGTVRLTVNKAQLMKSGEDKIIYLIKDKEADSRYFVYNKAEYGKSFDNAAAAIAFADEKMGVVVDISGSYVWKRGNTYSSRNLSGITIQANEENTLAACLDAVLKSMNVMVSSETLLDNGKSVCDIFEEYTAFKCLDLSRAELSQILYCVNEGKPVIGKTGDNEYAVIIGYDSANVTILSAITGRTSKMKTDAAEKLFKENGNIFISYLK